MRQTSRRDVLRSSGGLAVLSAAGLAGCSSVLPGGGNGCGTPSGGVEEALPSGGEYTRDGDPEYYPRDNVPAENESVSADYEGPDGASYALTIREYASREAAQDAWGDTSDFPSGIGYVVEGRYVYFVRTEAGTEDGIAGLLAAVAPLDESCVDGAAQYT
jgi:hypothetical protein